jgi:hypothetical protein
MGVIFLGLFSVTLFGLYIAIRRGWGDTLIAGGAGAMLSVVFVVLYALVEQDTSVGQALFSGVVVGGGFSAAVVIIATFFRTNQPSTEVRLISQAHPEVKKDYGQRDHLDQKDQ